MKITIDTERKVIELEATVKFEDLIEELKELLGKEWKEYSIEQSWGKWTYPVYPYYPITYPTLYDNDINSSPLEITTYTN